MASKSDMNSSAAKTDENAAMLLAAASAVSPVNELNAVNRAALCRTATVVHVQRNDQIKPENSHRWLMYLVEGSLTLYNGKEEAGVIAARTPDSLQPLFQDRGAYTQARTQTVAKIVKFGREQLDILLKEQQKNSIHVIDVEVGARDNVVFDEIVAVMKNSKAVLASSSDTSAKILASFRRIGGIPELSEVIQSDPGLATHIVNVANRTDGGSSHVLVLKQRKGTSKNCCATIRWLLPAR